MSIAQQERTPLLPNSISPFLPVPLNKSLKSHVRLLLDCDLHYLQGHWSPALVSISNKVVFFIFSNLWRSILNFYGTKKRREIHSDSAALGNVIKYVGAKEKVSSTDYSSICLLVKHNGSKSIGDRYFRAVSSFDFAALRLKDSLELVNTLSPIPCCTFYLGKE